jgi:predicted AAA+ superfamily ATPase
MPGEKVEAAEKALRLVVKVKKDVNYPCKLKVLFYICMDNIVLMYINRVIENKVLESLENNPVTAITGPRQCGKSTLARAVLKKRDSSVFLDLEKPSDLNKLDNAEWFLQSQKDKLIVLDEIQRKPEMFPLIRSLSDEWQQNGKFLILGSASRDLLQQSSESLAGRISYQRLTPFLLSEIEDRYSLNEYISRGGFPRSLLSKDDLTSANWLDDFISTFLERDILLWSGFSPATMRRLWQMTAHSNGQTINYTAFGNSLGVSNTSIRNYLDLLTGTFMVDLLPPYHKNFGKRIVKAPKVYVSDTGVTARLLGLKGFDQISGHPVFGSLWESIVLKNIKGHLPSANLSFYRTSNGAEIDILAETDRGFYAIECKASLSPKLNKGTRFALDAIRPDHTFIVAPVKEGWTVDKKIDVVSVNELIRIIVAGK